MKFTDIINVLGSGIDFKDLSTPNDTPEIALENKALFGKDKEQIAQLQVDLQNAQAKAKKSEDTVLYTVGAVIALMLFGIIKMK